MPPVAVRFKVEPAHCGVLLPTVGVGNAFMVTFVVVVAEHPFPSVTTTVYTPDAPVVTLVMEGFCTLEENPLGPVQAYVEPPVAVRFKVDPAHCGVLLPAVGVGSELIVTFVVVVAIHPFPSVTVTV